MSILDKRVCEDDINRVIAVRHRPKYEPGFEKECREERVWYIKGGNNLPFGYYMFEEVQAQFDSWQAGKARQNMLRQQSLMSERNNKWSGEQSSRDRQDLSEKCSMKEKKQTLFDKITDLLLEYAGMK